MPFVADEEAAFEGLYNKLGVNDGGGLILGVLGGLVIMLFKFELLGLLTNKDVLIVKLPLFEIGGLGVNKLGFKLEESIGETCGICW